MWGSQSGFYNTVLLCAVCAVLWIGCGQSEGKQYSTYINTKYHYQIEYPATWIAEGNPQRIQESLCMNFFTVHHNASGEKDMAMLQVYVYENPRVVPPEQWYEKEARQYTDGLYPYPKQIVAKTQVTSVNSYPAYKVNTTDKPGGYDYFIGHKNLIYHLSFDKFNGEPGMPKEIFEHAINSFRILE